MIERIIENWLSSVGEREFEIPYRQLLATQGHTVLHITRHGPAEQGKDIIAKGPKGEAVALQLKAGNITQKVWRDIFGQITELVTIRPRHPSLKRKGWHRAVLVTTGQLSEEVRRSIGDFNADHRGRQAWLDTVVGTQLLPDFQKLHGKFLPSDIPDFGRFLDLLRLDGRDMPPHGDIARLLSSLLPVGGSRSWSRAALGRSLPSALVLMSYIVGNQQRERNHVAVAEMWILFAAHILAAAEGNGLDRNQWEATFQLAVEAASMAYDGLLIELERRSHLIEGNPLADPPLLGPRTTMLLGHLSAYAVGRMLVGRSDWRIPVLDKLAREHAGEMKLWGEGAVPHALALAWYLEWTGRATEAAALTSKVAEALSAGNGGAAMPGPYYPAEVCVRHHLGLELIDDSLSGRSYALRSAVEWLARRSYRQTLARLWPNITRIQTVEFIPDLVWQTGLWRVEHGEERSEYPAAPQSWGALQKASDTARTRDLPRLLNEVAWFVPMFLLVYPHRIRPALVWRVDRAFEDLKRGHVCKGYSI